MNTTATCDAIIAYFSPLIKGLGWLASSLIGAMIGARASRHLDRVRAVCVAQTEILKRLDSCPSTDLDNYLSDSMALIRGPLFTAIPYLRSKDQKKAIKIWQQVKSSLEGKPHERNELMEPIAKFFNNYVQAKEDAFRQIFTELYDTLSSSSRTP